MPGGGPKVDALTCFCGSRPGRQGGVPGFPPLPSPTARPHCVQISPPGNGDCPALTPTWLRPPPPPRPRTRCGPGCSESFTLRGALQAGPWTGVLVPPFPRLQYTHSRNGRICKGENVCIRIYFFHVYEL